MNRFIKEGLRNMGLNVTKEAADYIDQLESALLSVNAVAIERGDKFGVCDQIDNDGQPYPSQWLAGLLAQIAPTSDATSNDNQGKQK